MKIKTTPGITLRRVVLCLTDAEVRRLLSLTKDDDAIATQIRDETRDAPELHEQTERGE